MQVVIYNLKGKKLHIVKNAEDASQFTNLDRSEIVACLHNRRNFASKFQFRYKYGKKHLKNIMPIK